MILILFFNFLALFSCIEKKDNEKINKEDKIIVGAECFGEYLSIVRNKKIGVVSNHTSIIENTHLIDTLISLGIDIKTIFAPEHGFRGAAEAGEVVGDHIDKETGVSIVSLYGKNYKPTKDNLSGLDIIVFDIQDVGVRFFTYLSTLHYVMEACAENGIPIIVLDRPNPNGFYIDGPVMEKSNTSFIGLHPVPIVYGMTIGEYAKMINGEGWLKENIKCELTVIPCVNYTRDTHYNLPRKPSPNLPTMRSVYLYPSLALFEGTVMSEGRGTDFPFEVFGHPKFEGSNFRFTPRSIQGMSKNPKHKGEECFGMDLRDTSIDYLRQKKEIQLEWLLLAYKSTSNEDFFIPFFKNLAGTDELKEQIVNNIDVWEIRASWEKGLQEFKKVRAKYLIYH